MLFIIYLVLSYMAINKVWYSKRAYLVRDSAAFYMQKAIYAALFGWILIPVAVIMLIFGK